MKDLVFRTLMLKGEAGGTIASIEKTGTSGNVDTYTITLNDGATQTFEVTNGSSIVSLAKTGTVGNVDTYTLTYNTGETFNFTVTNANVVNSMSPDPSIDKETNAPSIKAVGDSITNAILSAINNVIFPEINSAKTYLKDYTDDKVAGAKSAAESYAKNYADSLVAQVVYSGTFSTSIYATPTSGTFTPDALSIVVNLVSFGKILIGNINIFSPFGSNEISLAQGQVDNIDISSLQIPRLKLPGYAGELVNIANNEQYRISLGYLSQSSQYTDMITFECLFTTVAPQSNGLFATIPICVLLN